jgi:hypothetical protein
MGEDDRELGLSTQGYGSNGSADLSPAASGLHDTLKGPEYLEVNGDKQENVHGRGDSVTSKDGLLDDAYGSESTKLRRLYSVKFDEAPSLSDDVIGYAKNTKRRCAAICCLPPLSVWNRRIGVFAAT